MDKKTEALKLALVVLKEVQSETFRLMRNGQKLYAEEKVWNAITAIKEALAQPEQEPVAWRWLSSKTWKQWSLSDDKKLVAEAVEWLGEEKVQPLYTTPPQRKPLTDEDLDKLADLHRQEYGQLCDAEDLRMFARAAIEAAHGITSKE